MTRKKLFPLLYLCLVHVLFGCDCGALSSSRGGQLELDLGKGQVLFVTAPGRSADTQSFYLYNSGTSPVEIEAIGISGGPYVLLESPDLPLVLEPGRERGVRLRVRLEAPRMAHFSGRIEIVAPQAKNADGQGRFWIELQNQVRQGRLSFSCQGKLHFAGVRHGKSQTKLCKIENRGSHPVEIKAIQADVRGEFGWKASSPLPLVLQPEGKNGLTLEIAYRPKDLSSLSDVGTLRLKTDLWLERGEPAPSIGLSGQTLAAVLAIEPLYPSCAADEECQWLDARLVCDGAGKSATCKAGPMPVLAFPRERSLLWGPPNSTNTPTATVYLVSKGNLPVRIERLELRGPQGADGGFALAAPSLPLVLPPHTRRAIELKYWPSKTQDVDLSGTLIAFSNAVQGQQVLLLRGHGKGSCRLRAHGLRKDAFDLGAVEPPGSRTRVLEFENVGLGACQLRSLRFEQPGEAFVAEASALASPLTLAPGERWRLPITFKPTASSERFEGFVVLSSSDPHRPQLKLKLRGSTRTPCLTANPSLLQLETLRAGCGKVQKKIVVSNAARRSCPSITLTGMWLEDPHGAFRLVGGPTFPKALSPGQSADVLVEFAPSRVGRNTGILHLQTQDPQQRQLSIPMGGVGQESPRNVDQFHQLERPQADILFVIDNSPSMKEDQDNLAKNLKLFIQWAVRLNMDTRIMVTTTDVSQSPGCIHGAMIDVAKTKDPVGTFLKSAQVGLQGSSKAMGLEAAYRALSPPALQGCNKGFYRKSASLSLIFISDKPDLSPQKPEFYIHFFKSLKGERNADLLRASAIVGPPPSGCKEPGDAKAGPRYWHVAKALKGVRSSICDSGWAQVFSPLRSITFGYRSQFFLTQEPEPRSILVLVNEQIVGEDEQDGWRYDHLTNSVHFSKTQIPPPGAKIKISYALRCGQK